MREEDTETGRSSVEACLTPGVGVRIRRRLPGSPTSDRAPVLEDPELGRLVQGLVELLEEPVGALAGARLEVLVVRSESSWSAVAGTDGLTREHPRPLTVVEVVVRAAATRRRVFWQWAGADVTERLLHHRPALLREIEAALSAPALCEPVTCPVVLEPATALHLVHETVGHSLEADNYDAYARGLGFECGRRVSTSLLTVWDDPTDSRLASGYAFDDEGTPARPTRMLDHGVVDGVLTDAEHARRLALPPTGNGRRATHAPGALPRMSALRVELGEDRLDTLVSRIENGLMLYGSWGGGSSDEQFVVRPTHAEWISEGRLTGRLVRRLDLRGLKTEALRALDGISDTAVVFNPITGCDKSGQMLPVSMSSPGLSLAEGRLVPIR